jgi:hypothetical protein
MSPGYLGYVYGNLPEGTFKPNIVSTIACPPSGPGTYAFITAWDASTQPSSNLGLPDIIINIKGMSNLTSSFTYCI